MNPHGFRLIRTGLAKSQPPARVDQASFELREHPSADHLFGLACKPDVLDSASFWLGSQREAKHMGSDMDGSLKTSLTGIANLVDHANKIAKRSVQAAEAGNPESAMNLALEVELLLDEAVRMLNVAFAISKQRQEILHGHGDRKDPIRH
jgi:hypothetical protein